MKGVKARRFGCLSLNEPNQFRTRVLDSEEEAAGQRDILIALGLAVEKD